MRKIEQKLIAAIRTAKSASFGIPHASGTPISSTQWVNAFNAAHVSAF
jgi:hypothetical protein